MDIRHLSKRHAPRGASSLVVKASRQPRLRTLLGVAAATTVAAVLVAGAFAVTGSNTITTFAGIGEPGFSGDGGPATSARLNGPRGVAIDGQGNVYIAEEDNQRVRKVDVGGTITTIGGTGIRGFAGDGGPATLARFNNMAHLALDAQGNLYIADKGNSRIRKVNAAGTITTFAGGGTGPTIGDGGPATSARLALPHGVDVDGQGNVYIGDAVNHRVRKVDTAGIITTIAGTGAQCPRPTDPCGDGGPATLAQMYWPLGVEVDGQGNVYFADFGDARIRKIDTAGIITTIAGNGIGCPNPTTTCGDGGPATSASLRYVEGVALDAQGNLYIAESGDRVRKVDAGGTTSTITGQRGHTLGDGGPAILAQLFGPTDVELDAQGSLYIAQFIGSRVRKVDAGSQSTTTIEFAPLADKTYGDPDFTVSATASSGLPVSFAASGNCTVSGTRVHLTGAGSCTITASQPGDGTYPPAPSVSRTFAIAKAGQTITFAALPNRKVGDPDFTVSARASSGLAVAFAAIGKCTVSGARVHLTGAGSCTITASQVGNVNYNAAAVSRSFAIARKTVVKRCKVPNLVGKTLARARALIKLRHCRTGRVSKAYSRKRKKNVVIGQSRRPGLMMPANSRINLVVSRGRRR